MPFNSRGSELSLAEEDTVTAIDPIGAEQSLATIDGDAVSMEGPPDGGYGWVVCFAISLLNGFTWGVAAVCSQWMETGRVFS